MQDGKGGDTASRFFMERIPPSSSLSVPYLPTDSLIMSTKAFRSRTGVGQAARVTSCYIQNTPPGERSQTFSRMMNTTCQLDVGAAGRLLINKSLKTTVKIRLANIINIGLAHPSAAFKAIAAHDLDSTHSFKREATAHKGGMTSAKRFF